MLLSIQQEDEVRQVVALLLKRPITEELALRIGDISGFKHLEIRHGEWLLAEQDESMTGEQHGWIEALLITALTNWAVEHKTGRVYSGDTDFVLEGTPENILLRREPDIAFVPRTRLQKTKGYFYGAPDLAVEIVSPSQKRPEMVHIASEYLLYGTTEVWLVFPALQQIEVYTPVAIPRLYGIQDTLVSADLLPNFALALATVFEDEDE